MKHMAVLFGFGIAGLCLFLSIAAVADDTGPDLGPSSPEAPEFEQPAVSAPTEPETQAEDRSDPADRAAEPSNPPGQPQDEAAETPRARALAHLEAATAALDAGRYDRAVREASRAIAVDPEHAAEYREVRATAYLALGRFEEAFSDKSPLEVTVAAPRARLKSGKEVIATLPAGTRLLVDEARGNWLKVVSVGDEKFDWAWIHQRDVRAGIAFDEAAPAPDEIDDGRADRGPVYVDPRGYPGYVPPDPYYGGPGGDYGRMYYDWWQHVPPRYWRYLPR